MSTKILFDPARMPHRDEDGYVCHPDLDERFQHDEWEEYLARSKFEAHGFENVRASDRAWDLLMGRSITLPTSPLPSALVHLLKLSKSIHQALIGLHGCRVEAAHRAAVSDRALPFFTQRRISGLNEHGVARAAGQRLMVCGECLRQRRPFPYRFLRALRGELLGVDVAGQHQQQVGGIERQRGPFFWRTRLAWPHQLASTFLRRFEQGLARCTTVWVGLRSGGHGAIIARGAV